MSLPKISYPLFDVVIPSSGKAIKMRPFLVKEEKILLMAQTTGNPKDIVDSIKQVVHNCIIDDINADNLTTFDIEFLFVRLRSRSVNNKIEILYRDVDDDKQYPVEVDLDKVEIKTHPDHTNKIQINPNIGIILKYPNTDMIERMGTVESEVDIYFEIIKYCVDKIYDEENVYNLSDYSQQEVDDFLSTLDVSTFKNIQKFLDTMPKLHYEASYTTEAGVEKKIVLQSLNDFFMLG